MATWIELRCEKRGTKCESDRNAGPMDLSGDNQRDVIETLRGIQREALKGGWIRTTDGWVCPQCIKEPTTDQSREG